MKYFKSTESSKKKNREFKMGRNDGALWLTICKLFNNGKPVEEKYFTSLSSIITDAREAYWQNERERNIREMNNQAQVEDNNEENNNI